MKPPPVRLQSRISLFGLRERGSAKYIRGGPCQTVGRRQHALYTAQSQHLNEKRDMLEDSVAVSSNAPVTVCFIIPTSTNTHRWRACAGQTIGQHEINFAKRNRAKRKGDGRPAIITKKGSNRVKKQT